MARFAFNRTSLELKQRFGIHIGLHSCAFNRTSLELKHGQAREIVKEVAF